MTQAAIKIKCTRCLGTGMDDNMSPSISCVGCDGDGWTEVNSVDTTAIMEELDWLHKKVKKILIKLEIPE